MAIQIKEGRYYKDGLGSVGGPAERVENDYYPWLIKFSGILRTYTDDGARFVDNGGHDTDLVSECDAEGNPIKDEAMTEAAQLVMKEGAYYEDGRRRVFGPMSCRNVLSSFPWVALNAVDYTSFTNTGVAKGGYHNLVREVPKTGTITQEMVDRAILDAFKTGDVARANQIYQTWVGMHRALTNAY